MKEKIIKTLGWDKIGFRPSQVMRYKIKLLWVYKQVLSHQ